MPKRGRQQLLEQRVFFVTSTIENHVCLFNTFQERFNILSIIDEAMNRHGDILYGYVIMSNHFHLLVRVENGGPQLSKLMHNIKSISSHKLFSGRGGVWQKRFDDVAIYSMEQFRIKLNYIHDNPVRAGMVHEANHYKFSSAIDWLGGQGLIRVCSEML